MKKLKFFIFIIAISFVFLSCNDTTLVTTDLTSEIRQEPTSQEDLSIRLEETSIDLPLKSGYRLEYTLNFELSASESLVFESENPEIVSVDDSGFIFAKAYGETTLTISYLDLVQVSVSVHVSKYYQINLPSQATYRLGEPVNLSNASMIFYAIDGQVLDVLDINQAMILDQKLSLAGEQELEISINNYHYYLSINRLTQKQTDVLFEDFIYLDDQHYVGEKVEFVLFKSDNDLLLSALENVYDYQEINIYASIEKPDHTLDTIYAFWYQDYTELVNEVTIDPALRLEGTVNDTDQDYDVLVRFKAEGKAHFRMRYLPQEAGVYDICLNVEVDGVLIQTFAKQIEVQDQKDSLYRGFVRVDEDSKSHFVFDNQESYIPVGQNLAWYTSLQRKHYDYLYWLDQMSDVGMNYARVWMAAWGFSPFWDDIYNFDNRQTNLFSLDKTIEFAEFEDIYIQLCLLHHGMFSQETNPMWSNSEINWYTSKYGVNPYADVIDDPGLFFTDEQIIENFKNQLKYIVARYGYSDHIMAFEIFNEVDWIETYNVSDGLVWHQEIAGYLKEIDSNQHLVTTSLKGIDYDGASYKVFLLKDMDFINVHAYGIYNHTETLPNHQYYIQSKFNKPVMFNEIGYSGWGGQAQIEADPNNVTLHQGLWAGAMGGGLGTGMHWWWESWIDTYDVYHEFEGVARYLKELDLTGANQEIVYSEDNYSDDVSIDSQLIGFMGYKYTNRLYLYIYDKTYNLNNQSVDTKEGIELNVSALDTGTYLFKAYDTFTGDLIDSFTLDVNQETMRISLPSFNQDIAILIEAVES